MSYTDVTHWIGQLPFEVPEWYLAFVVLPFNELRLLTFIELLFILCLSNRAQRSQIILTALLCPQC